MFSLLKGSDNRQRPFIAGVERSQAGMGPRAEREARKWKGILLSNVLRSGEGWYKAS